MSLFYAFLGLASGLAFFGFGYSFWPVLVLLIFSVLGFKREPGVLWWELGGLMIGTALFFLVLTPPSGYFQGRGIVIKAEENWFILLTLKGRYYVYDKTNSLEMFDVISFKGKGSELSFSHYQESFDFKEYLKSEGTYKSLILYSKEAVFNNPIRINSFKSSLLAEYPKSVSSFIASLVFSDSLRKTSIYYGLKKSGLTGLFSSSGLHIAFLIRAITWLSEKKLKPVVPALLGLSLSVFNLVISSFSPSGLRIFLFYLLGFLILKGKIPKLEYAKKLSICGIGVLLLNPMYVISQGFYMTYPVLLVFNFGINSIIKKEKGSRIKKALLFPLLFLPWHLVSMHGISPFYLFMEVLASPLVCLAFLLNLPVFFGKISVPFLNWADGLLVKLFSHASSSSLFLSSGHQGEGFIAAFYLLLILFFLLKEMDLKRARIVLAAVSSFFLVLVFLPDFQKHYEVHFIDVGQGDSTLVRYGKENILIDTGGSLYTDLAQECLIPYFHSLKINSLDLVLTTHEDYDHVGALDSLKENFKVSRVIKGGEEKEINLSGLHIEDLNNYRYAGAEENYASAVFSFSIRETSFLIMGDATKEIEALLIKDKADIDCDVLKVGHHGSDTSSSLRFLMAASPSLAVISCGLNNLYGHPSRTTINNLQALGIPYVRTDYSGTFIYKA